MKSILNALIAICLGAGATDLRAQPASLVDASSTTDGVVTGSPSIIRETSLVDLGYIDGVEFDRLSGQATLYFPVPDARPVTGGAVRLGLVHGATNDVERHLKVSVGNRVVRTQPLAAEGGALEISVPIGPEDVRDGFVSVGLSYSGAYSDRVCVDERVSGDFLRIAPTSGLALFLDPARIDTPRLLAAFMPRDVRIRFAEDAPVDMAFAATAAAAFGAEAGHLSYGVAPPLRDGDVWSTMQVVVEPSDYRGASEMTVSIDGAAPVLRITGIDPQVGLRQLGSTWSGLADDPDVRTDVAVSPARDADAIPLSGLRGSLNARPVSSDTAFETSFAAEAIPAGKRIDAVSLIVASALDPQGRGVSVTAFMNGSLLGSRPLDSGDPQRMTFGIPDGLIGRANTLRVEVRRQPSGGNCTDEIQSYPAQILPGSALRLRDDATPPDDFFRLTQTFSQGVALVVDPALDPSRQAFLGWVGTVAGAMLPDGAPVLVTPSVEAAHGPFIFVSHTPPADSDPRVRLDNGAIEIVDSEGSPLFDGRALDRVGLVQIVAVDGVKGLWIRPGSGPAPAPSDADRLILDRGDLALFDETGILLATSTGRRDLIAVTYPDRTSVTRTLANYRPWIIGGVWLILTLLVLGFFQRLRGGRRTSDTQG